MAVAELETSITQIRVQLVQLDIQADAGSYN